MTSEIATIMEAVLRQTRAGSVKWEPAEIGNDDEYEASTERFRYYVSTRDGDGQPPHIFEVWKRMGGDEDKNRRLIEVSSTSATPTMNRMMNELLEIARGQAAGLSGSVRDEILKDLGL